MSYVIINSWIAILCVRNLNTQLTVRDIACNRIDVSDLILSFKLITAERMY
jgi:hypothetical protein